MTRQAQHRLPPLAAWAITLAGACSSHPQPGPVLPEPEPIVEPPPPPPPPQQRAPGELAAALDALAKRNYDAAYAHLLDVVELCGGTPLGQQALLLIAAAELDPRNPDPRRGLAVQSAALLLDEIQDGSWLRQFTESLYLISLRLGATRPGPADPDAAELGWRLMGREAAAAEAGGVGALQNEDPAEWARVESANPTHSATGGLGKAGEASGYCEAAWPTASQRSPVATLPTLSSSSYPSQLAALRERVRELEQELERIRRIVTRR